MKYILLIALISFISCNSNEQQVNKKPDKPATPTVHYPLRVKPNLYYINDSLVAISFDSTDENLKSIVYLIEPGIEGEATKKIPLKDLIDTATFEFIGCDLERSNPLGDCFFRDKNYVYTYFKTTFQDKGYVSLNKTMDPKTFHPIEGSVFSADSSHIYYRDRALEDVDVKSFKTLKDQPPFYAKDKKGFINGGRRFTTDEAKRLGLIK